MKILYFRPGHIKNTHGLELMCASYDIELVKSFNIDDVYKADYDIVISNDTYFDPDSLPKHVKIIFGPQFSVFPAVQLIGSYNAEYETRVVYNSLSKWVGEMMLTFSELKFSIVQFPFAVDIDNFYLKRSPNYDCLVYVKARHKDVMDETLGVLLSKGMTFKIIQYGSYTETDYKEKLVGCRFMLVLDAHESQGFALEEAMSCNVPLLVLDAQSMHDEVDARDYCSPIYNNYKDKSLKATSVPYWSDECGLLINHVSEMPDAVDNMLANYMKYNPREYILSTLSPKPCMERILNYFDLTV
jgi:glycosyltransferase involved in cell wall biosynthesis